MNLFHLLYIEVDLKAARAKYDWNFCRVFPGSVPEQRGLIWSVYADQEGTLFIHIKGRFLPLTVSDDRKIITIRGYQVEVVETTSYVDSTPVYV